MYPTLNIAILIIKRKVDPITNKHGGFVPTSLLSRPRAALSLQTNKRIKRKKMTARGRLKTPEKLENSHFAI